MGKPGEEESMNKQRSVSCKIITHSRSLCRRLGCINKLQAIGAQDDYIALYALIIARR